MAFKKPEIHTIKPDIKNAYIYLRAVKKWGKTTLWREIILQKYNGDSSRGLLVEVGNEHGTTMLDNINVTHVSTYKDMIELQKWLIAEKGKEHNIEMICFDVVDEIPEIFDKEVCRLSTLENPNKPCVSVKAAFGGYNSGPEMSANKIKGYLESLKNAGFGIMMIGHTKMKPVSDKASTEEDKWMSLTGTLSSNYEAAIADVCDIVLTGNIEREFKTKGEGDNAKRYLAAEERRLYFRGTELIDAGGRFATGAVPYYIVFNGTPSEFAKELIETIEIGMEKSKSQPNETQKRTITPIKGLIIEREEDIPEVEDIIEDAEEDIDLPFDLEDEVEDNNNEEYFDIDEAKKNIRALHKAADAATKQNVKEILDGAKLNEVNDEDKLKEILKALA